VPLPDGYSIKFEGQHRLMEEAFEELTLALILAVILVYAVMAAQFESFVYPFTIMFTVPFAAIGVVFGLLLTGRSFNVPAFMGVIMLAGIVVNNAIVLVDYINQLKSEGVSAREAIIQAGPTRLRPVLMTTLTTVLGLFPLALGIGEGAEIQAPLATVVIGGLLASTLLTLIATPVIYSLVDDVILSIKRKLGKKTVKDNSVKS
jgi:HAE1 family hydrophobic/amphiphilic exporter-1